MDQENHPINRVVRAGFHLALILAAVALILGPIHAQFVQRADIVGVHSENQVSIALSPDQSLEAGQTVKVYRFNPGWARPIGEATVVSSQEDTAIIRYDPTTFAWPMGVQGTVLHLEDTLARVNLGTSSGVQKGTQLNLFENRVLIGQGRLVEVGDEESLLQLIRTKKPIEELLETDRLVVSQYQVSNQVGWLAAPALEIFEWFVLAIGCGLWLFSLLDARPARAMYALGRKLRETSARTPPGMATVLLLMLGIPATSMIGPLIAQLVFGIDSRILHLNLIPPTATDTIQWTIVAAFGLWWVWTTVTRNLNPAHAMWSKLAPVRSKSGLMVPGYLPGLRSLLDRLPIPGSLVMWLLHWPILYMFSSTLTGFMVGNMNYAAGIGWAGLNLSFNTPPDFLQSCLTMLVTAPEVANIEAGFSIARYILWTLTIGGCLFGYWHTALSIMWKAPIRSMDFTPMGWLTNGICYGPIFGWAIYNVFPSQYGIDPVLVGGPLLYIQLVAEFWLNLMYTLSIWNLGKRFGVMVDKGVETRGFYTVVRHPSYTLEPLMFMVMGLGAFSTPYAWLGAMAFPIKYWLRAERDDQWLSAANPDYLTYKEKVPWKFIRGIY